MPIVRERGDCRVVDHFASGWIANLVMACCRYGRRAARYGALRRPFYSTGRWLR